MNTHKLELTAKARHLCFLLLLCLRLAWGGVPGPCRHSVTKDQLLSLNRLIDNQLDNGCSIIYSFTERQSLSKVCYIKTAFPQILELLNTHFQYARKSDNRRYVNTLKKVIYNLYSQRCIPEINEEIEDHPVRFMRVLRGSPKEALKKAKGVIQMYRTLMTESTGPVDWNCQAEYAAEEDPESTSVFDTVATGGPGCQCSCPTFTQTTTASYPPFSLWSQPKQPGPNQPSPAMSLSFPHPPPGTLRYNAMMGALETERFSAILSMTAAVPDRHPLKERELSWQSPPPTRIEHGPMLLKAESDIPETTYDTAHLARPGSLTLGSSVFVDKTEDIRENFTYSPLGNGIEGSPKEQIAVSGLDAAASAPHLYDMDLTPSSDQSKAHVLAKRSLDTKNFGIQHNSNSVRQDEVASPGPEAKATKARYRVSESIMDSGDHKTERIPTVDVKAFQMSDRHSYKLKIIFRDLQAQARDLQTPMAKPESNKITTVYKDMIRTDKLSNREGDDINRASLHEGLNEELLDGNSSWQLSRQAVFIMAAVSGGMLFIFVWCCFTSKRRLGSLVHRSSVIESQRVDPDPKDMELKSYETRE
uniref:uncharacterized protein n=1 Tax=Centroberyx gerrardi TaxID=166262 RepID=UPI003AACAFC9